MLLARNLFFFLFIYLGKLEIQINFHLTDFEDENNDTQHDCLQAAARVEDKYDIRQIISYCIDDWPSKFNITDTGLDPKFNFSQLSKRNVTTEQLYLWSAPIDLIEEYQLYLNQLPNSDRTLLASKLFYNCTLPYFGSKCQYKLITTYVNYTSFNEVVYDYYFFNRYKPTEFTCYSHLECDRGPSPACLDWTEICDGKIDCFNDGVDEKDCWQLKMHQCGENEFRCSYGQCVPVAFVFDNPFTPDCLDRSDEIHASLEYLEKFEFVTNEPIFKFEDVSCRWLYNTRSSSTPFLSSSCLYEREMLLSKAMFSIKPNLLHDECWTAMKCIIQMPDSLLPTLANYFQPPRTNCTMLCRNGFCDAMVQKHCPDVMYVPAYPIFNGHGYIGYAKTETNYRQHPLKPTYICFDSSRFHIPNDGKTLFISDNRTCRLYEDAIVNSYYRFEVRWLQRYVLLAERWLNRVARPNYNASSIFSESSTYQCANSEKRILKTQVLDGISDCYYADDENSSKLQDTHFMKQLPNAFKCPGTDQYVPARQVNDGYKCDCQTSDNTFCADEMSDRFYFRKKISFQTICDNEEHLLWRPTNDSQETDETNCEYWPLVHVYNRCDGFWHFPNGSDEVDCDPLLISLLNCSKNSHICISIQTKSLTCLPIEKANDGVIDCIGAADEPSFCDRRYQTYGSSPFYCSANKESSCIQGNSLCNGIFDCPDGEDENACSRDDVKYPTVESGICTLNYRLHGSVFAKVLCRLFYNTGKRSEAYFTFDSNSNTPKQPLFYKSDIAEILPSYRPEKFRFYQQRCHRGFPLQISFNKDTNLTRDVCLCPPSFYGNTCQYQNQRISITLQFRAPSNSSETPFLFVVSLIDDSDERLIHSFHQFTYLFAKNCQRKFNLYLLYSTRPKNMHRQYSIQIHIYEQITLNYRGSFLKSVNYTFLPVHRLAFQLDIPHSNDIIETCVDQQCLHGKCIKYFNDLNRTSFCQCYEGWSGRYCHIQYKCLCSSRSLCLGKIANNRSLCVCPITKIGPRCLIPDYICQSQPCMNGGTCVRTDEADLSPDNRFICICPKNFFGVRCELARTKLLISYDESLDPHLVIFIHFIEVQINNFPIRTTTFKRILLGQNFISIYWSFPFHVVLVELPNQRYYLALMQKKYTYQRIIEKTLASSDRCLSVNALFNETFRNYHLLRRIKYYHIPCQTNSSLTCFYDDQQFCFCQQLDEQRVANCFDFDRHSRTTCARQNDCENGGNCYEENSKCPKYFLCECTECYYGVRCQLTTNGFSLSLDAILGFYIHPKINLFKQSGAVLISIIVSTVLIIVGLVNGALSSITFKSKKLLESGCAIYLLNSSIIVLLTMIIFTFKFWILILTQIETIRNKSFLKIECICIDFILRSCLAMDQWLTSFVSIERAFVTIKGVSFNQKQAQVAAKYVVCVLFFLIISTNIHDPIHRSLYEENEDDEKRFWCI
ncbi:unnamed protein product [Adineta ricciae]|uniref:EGF-like domain-containing protein n=1 Tax=Adineta ricciae TaxID=249248 RepID=A0A815KZQ5_ADIRI|nr:unnamed protein product [Adineta ricciae]CAF1400056.1 unnamed protein product [Adineta ricciae]